MGGIAIFAALVLMTFIGGYVSTDTFVMLAVTLLFGLIGFFDDYIKVAKKHNLGLRAWQKLVLQILFAGALAVYMANYSGYGTEVWIPFIDKYIDFGALYIPFVIFVVVAMANAVNLTDGLDGLSSGVTALVAFFFAIVGMEFGHNSAAIFCTALTGACLGFQQIPCKAVHGRYRFYGSWRCAGVCSDYYESGISFAGCRTDLCTGSTVCYHSGGIF